MLRGLEMLAMIVLNEDSCTHVKLGLCTSWIELGMRLIRHLAQSDQVNES